MKTTSRKKAYSCASVVTRSRLTDLRIISAYLHSSTAITVQPSASHPSRRRFCQPSARGLPFVSANTSSILHIASLLPTSFHGQQTSAAGPRTPCHRTFFFPSLPHMTGMTLRSLIVIYIPRHTRTLNHQWSSRKPGPSTSAGRTYIYCPSLPRRVCRHCHHTIITLSL